MHEHDSTGREDPERQVSKIADGTSPSGDGTATEEPPTVTSPRGEPTSNGEVDPPERVTDP